MPICLLFGFDSASHKSLKSKLSWGATRQVILFDVIKLVLYFVGKKMIESNPKLNCLSFSLFADPSKRLLCHPTCDQCMTSSWGTFSFSSSSPSWRTAVSACRLIQVRQKSFTTSHKSTKSLRRFERASKMRVAQYLHSWFPPRVVVFIFKR